MEKKRSLRKLRSAGFVAATDDMIGNLDTELETFRKDIESGQRAQVAWRPGSGGGGSVSWQLIVLLILIIVGIKASRWRT
jgi:rhombotail lipoprotein